MSEFDSIEALLESEVDLERVATIKELSIEWRALRYFDADLTSTELDDPLAVHDRIIDALAAHDGIDVEPEAIDVHIQDIR